MRRTIALRGRSVRVLLAGLLAAVVLPVLAPSGTVGAPSSASLQQRIDAQRSREQRLVSTADRLAALERTATRAVDAAEQRLAGVQAQYDATQARLQETSTTLRRTRSRLVRLHRQLSDGREVLARVLRSRYTADRPGLVEVVVSAQGFNDLLEQVAFLKRVQAHDTRLVSAVRRARNRTVSDEQRLATLRRRQVRQATVVARQRDAMAAMTAGLEARRDTVHRAHRARLEALSAARGDRRRAERALTRLTAAQARAAREFNAPRGAPAAAGGPWAIPWPIVQCESGGQNVGPNSAGASGYYQFMPQTWRGLGGSTPNAYQASKAEQDRLAARLWNGGAGARNWDCAAMVGITG